MRELGKKDDKSMVFERTDANLPGFEFLDRSAPFLEKDAVTTVRAAYVYINLDFLLASCTFIGTCHNGSVISRFLLRFCRLHAGQFSCLGLLAGMHHRRTCTRTCGTP